VEDVLPQITPAGRLELSAVCHGFGHVLQNLIVYSSPFKSGILPGAQGFLDIAFKPIIT
jgi:hypothetical protein